MVTGTRLCFAIAKAPLSAGWAPFTGENGVQLLGFLDAAFMAAYTVGMPFMGRWADRVHVGFMVGGLMILCSCCLVLFGLAHKWEIHSLMYFCVITFFCGLAQSGAYPCVMAPLSNWFGQKNIGRTLGIWSSSSPLGNVIGKTLCTACLLRWSWPQVFFTPAFVLACVALVVILLLVPDPYGVDLLRPGEARRVRIGNGQIVPNPSFDELLADRQRETAEESAVPFLQLLMLPSLLSYCFALLGAKLVCYAFFNWLPLYLHQTVGFSQGTAGYLSTLFDWGGFVGGLAGGWLSDKIGSRGLVCAIFQVLACILMFVYVQLAATAGYYGNVILLFFLGACTSAPYNLITSVAGVDLGRHPLLLGNSKAKATIIGLLDGTASFGACIQGPLVGFVVTRWTWDVMFYVLICISFGAALTMLGPARTELRAKGDSQARAPLADADGQSLQAAHDSHEAEQTRSRSGA
eukprot:gnl/TRDRNA2_/TRDRNA2_200797_c0_seq1.p1 gnl/TRDRNA2_/TRDRNA2_200797_c0~~gnl/TRDRNA2_/TRDRNA2_200797_c0_seq1.p1  ORF type:complete len:515 (-),score=53.57 gnl/TRDRNA2_/TRDRNA2_200797_c0_seq1:214-1602(-)